MTRAEGLADELERAYQEFADLVAALDERRWRATAANHPEIRRGEDERRAVGVVAHHVGDALPLLAERARRVATGEPLPPVTAADLDGINAKHAAVNPSPDQAETVAMIRDNASRAAAIVRELTDPQLERAGETGRGAQAAEAFIRRIAIGHAAWHAASIRATVGR